MTAFKRLRELDFLRGVAIILVLLRHQFIFQFTTNIGWIGVDLFFTLSGFLVSGLLFKEYLKFGNIEPLRFLIRRGFKIYPIYYLFYIPYLVGLIIRDRFYKIGFFSDMLFVQNYIWGWGFAYTASWSLAVEEHFYFGLALLIWAGIKFKFIYFVKPELKKPIAISFQTFIFLFFGVCIILRFVNNTIFPDLEAKNFTMTHLRIDSLFAGVYISYLYYFQKEMFINNFNKYKTILLILAFLFLAWTPFVNPVPSFFVKTIGFTLLYISFSIILAYFIINPKINDHLNSVFNEKIVNFISKIGYCSYSIYIIHSLVNLYGISFLDPSIKNNHYFAFISTSFISISLGFLMTYHIENYFLKIRNRLVPNRVLTYE